MAPVYSDFYVGQRFNLSGLKAVASYSNGLSAVLSTEECNFYMDGKQIDERYYFTKDDVGSHVITIKHAPTDTIDASSGEATFNIVIEDYSLSGISIAYMPTITSYAPGDEFNPNGMIIRGEYTNAEGVKKYANLSLSLIHI